MVMTSNWIKKEDVNCGICCIDRDLFWECKRCRKCVCKDCVSHDLKIHDLYPVCVYSCSYCRHVQQIDELFHEQIDYFNMDKSTLSKICLLYKKKLMGVFEENSNDFDSD